MKKLLLSIFCCGLGMAASAQSLDYITFKTHDGSEFSLPVEGLKITFEREQLKAVVKQQQAVFQLRDMAQMFFAATPTGIDHLRDGAEDISIINGRLKVNVPIGTQVQVYTMDGRRVKDNQLLRGAYLVNLNGRIYKLMAR